MSGRRIALLLVLAGAAGAAEAASCARFEPDVTHLTGTLALRDFAGPPNYESVARGDRLERQWILVLDVPLCVDGDPRSDLNHDPVSGQREVQLVALPGRADPAGYRGRRIAVAGILFAAHTGHHRTPVLLNVASIRAK